MNTIAHNVSITTGNKTYILHIERHFVTNDLLKQLTHGLDHVVITDRKVFDGYPEILEGLNFIAIPSGESSKSMEVYLNILEQMIQLGISRKGIVIAFGGGVVGDLAGFVAATYMRGIRFVQIPTTLLAMVDSSVGGKVGINLKAGKNLVGAFHQPEAVFIDPRFLETLPAREFTNGMGEVIKYGLGFDEALFEKLVRLSPDKVAFQIDEIILRCLTIKARVIMEDEKDHGVRNLMNFGHTIGHAIEQYFDYEFYLHGEAISIGMAMKARIALESHRISETDFDRIIELLKKWNLPVSIEQHCNLPLLLETMRSDKKASVDHLSWIALKKIGELEMIVEPHDSAFSKFIGGLNAQSKL